jgi:hypothetical protein
VFHALLLGNTEQPPTVGEAPTPDPVLDVLLVADPLVDDPLAVVETPVVDALAVVELVVPPTVVPAAELDVVTAAFGAPPVAAEVFVPGAVVAVDPAPPVAPLDVLPPCAEVMDPPCAVHASAVNALAARNAPLRGPFCGSAVLLRTAIGAHPCVRIELYCCGIFVVVEKQCHVVALTSEAERLTIVRAAQSVDFSSREVGQQSRANC